jgi:O-antigen/teichoic acid export membrane protein
MSTATRIAKNTGILYAKMGITMFISLYTTRLVLKSLGVTDFGIYNLVGGTIAMLTFLNAAMTAATQRFMSYVEGEGDVEKQKKIFNVSLILHIIIAFFVVLLMEVGGHLLFGKVFVIPSNRIDSATLVFQFMVMSTVFTIVSVPYDAVINAHENMLFYALLGIAEAMLKLVIVVYVSNTSSDRLVIYSLLTALLSVLLLFVRRIYCRFKYIECGVNISKYFDLGVFKQLSRFAAWSFLGSSTSMFANYGQGIIMNMFFGPSVNTAQGISGQVSGQLGVFAATMQKALNPVIDKSEGAGNRALMLKASLSGSKIAFFLLMFFYVPVLIEMPFIFKLWLFTVPKYTIIFCRLLLIRNLIEQLFITLNSAILAVGNIRNYQIFSSVLNILPLAFCYFLFVLGFPPFTLYILFIIYAVFSSAITLYFASINCDLSVSGFFGTVVSRCILLLIVVFAISFLPVIFASEGMSRLLYVVLLSCLSFSIFVFIIGFTKTERNGIFNIIRSLVKHFSAKSFRKSYSKV